MNIELDKEFDYEKHNGDSLLEWFAVWYLKRAKREKCLPLRTIQDNCFYKAPQDSRTDTRDSVSGLTLYRQKDLQVQLFIFPPNAEVSPHIHPNMDSFEAYIGGEPFFQIDGIETQDHEKLKNFDNLENKESFYNKLFLKSFRITEATSHHARFGEKGGAFLSIQHWKNGIKPTSPADDWEEV